MSATATRAPRDQTTSVFDADDLAAVFAALAHPTRLRILLLLSTRSDQSVGALAASLGESVANTSHHLARLRHAGLIHSHRDGTTITSTLDEDASRSLRGFLALVEEAPNDLSRSGTTRDG